jgi:hypothetical protein
MTFQEIHEEIIKDALDVLIKMCSFRKQFDRIVLKSTRYPVIKSYDFITRERKNKYNLTFKAQKRSQRRNPIFLTYAVFDRPEGKYAVTTSNFKSITIYPPHFFKRFRERILKGENISNNKLIKLYFKDYWGFNGAVVDKNFEEICRSCENFSRDEKISFVAALTQGYCFGENHGTVCIMKTIITEDMLFEKQKKVFTALKETLHENNRERYGKILYPYLSMTGINAETKFA